LQIFLEILGKEHQTLATCRANRKHLFLAVGKVDEAIIEMQEIVNIKRKTKGEFDASVRVALADLINKLIEQERFKEAEQYSRELLEFFEHKLGPESEDVADTHSYIAEFSIRQGAVETALTHMHKASDIYIKTSKSESAMSSVEDWLEAAQTPETKAAVYKVQAKIYLEALQDEVKAAESEGLAAKAMEGQASSAE